MRSRAVSLPRSCCALDTRFAAADTGVGALFFQFLKNFFHVLIPSGWPAPNTFPPLLWGGMAAKRPGWGAGFITIAPHQKRVPRFDLPTRGR